MESSPRSSSSRPAKRSSTNLSNLRLAPLSTKFAQNEVSHVQDPTSSYKTYHSSYIQGQSAPTTPGILSRSSSRHRLGAGLSRKYSVYEDAPYYPADIAAGSGRADVGSGSILKAKSEAALLAQQRDRPDRTQAEQVIRNKNHRRSKTGGEARSKSRRRREDDWLTRAGLATNAMLRESKGQSWLASRASSTSLLPHDSDSSEDEAAALQSASTQRLHFADDEFSPVASRWSSQFPSRIVSMRNSRRGSRAGSQPQLLTPGGPRTVVGQGADYFDSLPENSTSVEPDFVDNTEHGEEDESELDENEIARLAQDRSFGLGGWVDRLVGWSLFNAEEDGESSDDETQTPPRSLEGGSEAQTGGEAEARRREKERTLDVQGVPLPTSGAADEERGQAEGAWQDAAWLLSVASKVLL
ncbi:hypothetical protein LTR50_003692 [Elasticomyces elasticus]|nr:hypothetical protein LTR50_003692 [Elasticomyces elasticus]